MHEKIVYGSYNDSSMKKKVTVYTADRSGNHKKKLFTATTKTDSQIMITSGTAYSIIVKAPDVKYFYLCKTGKLTKTPL